jgi:hypothetical protein
MTPDLTRTHDLVDRLYRLNAAGDWADTLTPYPAHGAGLSGAGEPVFAVPVACGRVYGADAGDGISDAKGACPQKVDPFTALV